VCSSIQTRWRARLEPELTLLVQIVLYKYSVWDTGASYGAKLQNLRYTTHTSPTSHRSASRLPRPVLVAHAAFTILLPYAHARLRSHALAASWPDAPQRSLPQRVWAILARVEAAHAVLALANFLAFLYHARCVVRRGGWVQVQPG
jgi:peroxin-2